MSTEFASATTRDDINVQEGHGYINSCLMPGETVIYRTKMHWAIFIMPVIASCFIIGIPWLIRAIIQYLTSEFGLTNRRVIMKQGWISRLSVELLLPKIESFVVDQSVMGRILGFGNIDVRGTGGIQNIFYGIAKPLEFNRKVQEQLTQIQGK
jgi:uncharacterized membrane protein YdbT with pleckstrin-like domain